MGHAEPLTELLAQRRPRLMNKVYATMLNKLLFERAQKCIPGGVNSPVRAFQSVGGTPPFIVKGQGPYLWDVEGKRYIDYVGAWGPMVLGHAPLQVLESIKKSLEKGWSFGAPTALEVEIAELICQLMPSIEQVRLVSSGTEATMSALRLARGATGRDLIIKFEGCYHGHADSLLVKAGSGLLTFTDTEQNTSSSAGVPVAIAQGTLVLPYNDVEALDRAFKAHGEAIAAVIVEPVAGNMNLVKPAPEFLQRMRALCTHHGALLIFDEVMTGFRVALGGAQSLYEIVPDLTCLGKIIGGGMPLAAFGGRREIMAQLAPLGPVYQAGTLSGNPAAVTAGLATLHQIQQPGFYTRLSNQAKKLTQGINAVAAAHEFPLCMDSVGGMLGLYFSEKIPTCYEDVMAFDKKRFNSFFHALLEKGVYWAPSAYEAGFISITHNDDIIDLTCQMVDEVLQAQAS